MVTKKRAYLPQRGHIIHLNFDPSTGTEMHGKHYALVISDTRFNQHTGLAIVVAGTSQNYGDNVSRPLPDGLDLPKEKGYLRLHQIRSVDYEERGAEYIDKVPDAYVEEVAGIVARFVGVTPAVSQTKI